MFYIIIGFLCLAVILVGYGSIMRKRVYNQIDRYESWKIDIMNRPVTEEIARVKQLKVIGETEQKFEAWRSDWDDVVTVQLPAVEEKLFEAEDYVDKFRFKRAGAVLSRIDEDLNAIEERIRAMLDDLNEVVDSEQQNRQDITGVKEKYHTLKKRLITHPAEFQDAVKYLEQQMHEVENQFKQYEAETDNGNYIKAREVLVHIESQQNQIEEWMQIIPNRYRDIKVTIPNKLKEIQSGYEEMLEQGYVLDHLSVQEQIDEISSHLKVMEEGMKQGEITKVSQSLEDTFGQFEVMYDALEKEVNSRKAFMETSVTLENDIRVVGEKINTIDQETQTVQQTYRIDQEDIEAKQQIDRTFNQLQTEFNEVHQAINEKKRAFSIVLEKVEDMRMHLETLRESANEFHEQLKTLRKDELIAKENVSELKQKLLDARRIMQKGNLPGVPEFYIDIIDDAHDILNEVSNELNQKPLEMTTVNQLLEEAYEKVNHSYEASQTMVNNAVLSERLIQLGNKYRSNQPDLDQALQKAEQFFRSYNYQDAYEVAAAAMEDIEPDAVKQVNADLENIS
ncbi:septation ring formation regulator EzrA [Tuberibacillus sp. Marseille-P3662]|uniref:septation ring formation regulator EzrA n=1 Tax=Tuberibacillus sp. Marseille-P3662 TaxID=1965358 RepID=UPI0015946CDF|nr:septation ring formation regulator EzrA [Tuberibacillus sp. Marseille-P3662]